VRDISDARLALFVEANLLLGNVQIEVIVSFAKEMHNCFVGGTLLYCFCVSEQILYSYPLDLSHPCCFSVQISSVFNQKCYEIVLRYIRYWADKVELRSLVPLPLLFFTKDSGASFCEVR